MNVLVFAMFMDIIFQKDYTSLEYVNSSWFYHNLCRCG